MKFLAGIIFAVLAFATAVPLDISSNDLSADDFDDFLISLAYATEEDGRVEDGQNRLKDRLEYILETIKDAIDDGKAVKEDLLAKLKEIRAKLKAGVGEKAKELLKSIKESGRIYLKNMLRGLGLSKRAILENDQVSIDEVQKQLKDRLEEVLKKIKDAIDQGKAVREDMLKKMKELRQKMKDMNLEVGNKSKDILERIKEKGRDFLKEILEKLGLGQKAAEHQAEAIMLLAENQEILEWVDHIFEDNKEERRSMKDAFLKVKDYFKDLGIVLKEKYFRFGEWVKNQYETGLEKGKDELENVKKIAEKFLKDTKDMGKGVAREALNFFKEYEKDLGNVLDDIKGKIQDILKNEK